MHLCAGFAQLCTYRCQSTRSEPALVMLCCVRQALIGPNVLAQAELEQEVLDAREGINKAEQQAGLPLTKFVSPGARSSRCSPQQRAAKIGPWRRNELKHHPLHALLACNNFAAITAVMRQPAALTRLWVS